MKDININLSDVKNLFAKMAKNLSWTFFGIFLLLVVLEIFRIKNSVDIVLNVHQTPPVVTAQKGVRINFEAYNQDVQRIQAAPSFTPSGSVTQDPFAVPIPAGAQ